MPYIDQANAPTLTDIYVAIPQKSCWNCGSPMSRRDLKHYAHSGGWYIKGVAGRQWIYFHCRHCNYDTAIWKRGYPREQQAVTESHAQGGQ